MLKKLLTVIALSLVSIANAQGTPNQAQQSGGNPNPPNSRKTDERFDIMHVDETEDTDTLAIPLDSSEIEDEEEIDRLEKRPFKIDYPSKEQQRRAEDQKKNSAR